MKLNLLHLAGIIAIVQSLIMVFNLLIHPKRKLLSNTILACLLGCFAIVLTFSITQSVGLADGFVPYHKIIFIAGQFGFLIGPLFYFYIKSFLEPKFQIQTKHFLHGLPFLSVLMVLLMRFILIPEFIIWPFIPRFYISFLLLGQTLIYILASLRLLNRSGLTLNTFFRSTADNRISWLKFMIGAYIVFWIVKLETFILVGIANIPWWCSATASLFFIFLVVFFNTIVIVALYNPRLFAKMKYERSPLSDSLKQQYKMKLLKVMSEERPYLDSSCSLPSLAKQLSMSVNHLSQVINESFHQHYHDFINFYRIQDSKKLLEENCDNGKTILEIAYEVGYNSKTTFNTAFRKFNRITPKEYKKSLQATPKNHTD